VITCHRNFLLARCLERGYSLSEVMPCVVAQDGDQWTVNPEHSAYPKAPKPAPIGCLAGTELKKLLGRIGIRATDSCPCNKRAREMDARGCPWCRENIDTISGWLEEQAKARHLPYSHMLGKKLISMAISAAEKKVAAAS
jgi:hypothetical protein